MVLELRHVTVLNDAALIRGLMAVTVADDRHSTSWLEENWLERVVRCLNAMANDTPHDKRIASIVRLLETRYQLKWSDDERGVVTSLFQSWLPTHSDPKKIYTFYYTREKVTMMVEFREVRGTRRKSR